MSIISKNKKTVFLVTLALVSGLLGILFGDGIAIVALLFAIIVVAFTFLGFDTGFKTLCLSGIIGMTIGGSIGSMFVIIIVSVGSMILYRSQLFSLIQY